MLILGIDEAGRGAVLGPMVIGGVMIEKEKLEKLRNLGIRDSKLLTPKQRERMYSEIKKISRDHLILKVSAKQIDDLRKVINLNRIEAEKMANIIRVMKADQAIIDAPQVSTDKFKSILLGLAKNKTEIICENYADKKYPIVSAASIIAKVERDREIENIKKIVKYDFGVGYPHDERTINFIKQCLKEKKHLHYIRHSWVTTKNLKTKKEQKKLKDYK
jgi:ribonuclease HII